MYFCNFLANRKVADVPDVPYVLILYWEGKGHAASNQHAIQWPFPIIASHK